MVSPDPAAAIKALKPGVHYRHGTRRPYRSAPSDFREVFIRLGWDKEIMEHYGASWVLILRWIEECGGDELRAARAAVANRPVGRWRRSNLPSYRDAALRILSGYAEAAGIAAAELEAWLQTPRAAAGETPLALIGRGRGDVAAAGLSQR